MRLHGLEDNVPLYFVICKSYLKFFAIYFYRFVTKAFVIRNIVGKAFFPESG